MQKYQISLDRIIYYYIRRNSAMINKLHNIYHYTNTTWYLLLFIMNIKMQGVFKDNRVGLFKTSTFVPGLCETRINIIK